MRLRPAPYGGAGGELVSVGQTDADVVVIDGAVVDVIREVTADTPAQIIARRRSGEFLGELSMLSGQALYLTARVVEPGRVFRISAARFHRLMASDVELSRGYSPPAMSGSVR